MEVAIGTYNFGLGNVSIEDWQVVVDGVMGGLSSGNIVKTENSLLFRGSVRLENNGGFASIRTIERDFDLSTFSKVTIRYKSVGQDFSFYLNRYRRYYEPKFRTDLPITNNEWVTKTIALKDFKITRLGQEVEGSVTNDDLSNIIKLGFITNTKAATDFTLEVDRVIFE